MASTGIIRGLDKMGRVVLPRELRDTLDIKNKDSLEFYVDDNTIILKKYNPDCAFCGERRKLEVYKDKKICTKCIMELNKLLEAK